MNRFKWKSAQVYIKDDNYNNDKIMFICQYWRQTL